MPASQNAADTRSAGKTKYSPVQWCPLPPSPLCLSSLSMPAAFSQSIQLACFIKFHESPAALPHILCMLLIALHTHTHTQAGEGGGRGGKRRLFVVCLTGTCEYNSANLASPAPNSLPACLPACHSIRVRCVHSRLPAPCPLLPFTLAPILAISRAYRSTFLLFH